MIFKTEANQNYNQEIKISFKLEVQNLEVYLLKLNEILGIVMNLRKQNYFRFINVIAKLYDTRRKY